MSCSVRRRWRRANANSSSSSSTQLDAHAKIETQDGQLGALASEVKSSADALAALRDKMDAGLWKGVLNEVQAERERLWGQREKLVGSMQVELSNEQAGWERVHADHAQLLEERRKRRKRRKPRPSTTSAGMRTRRCRPRSSCSAPSARRAATSGAPSRRRCFSTVKR